MAANAVLNPIGAAIAKTVGGILALLLSGKMAGRRGAFAFEMGARMLSSVIEQVSYAQQLKGMIRDIAGMRFFAVDLSQWEMPAPVTWGQSLAPEYVPPPPPAEEVAAPPSPTPPPPEEMRVAGVVSSAEQAPSAAMPVIS
jgi:hypothetical protein